MKPHRIDPVSLIFGLLFLGLAGWWLLSQVLNFSPASAGWAAAISLVLLGTIGIVTSLVGNRTRSPEPGEIREESPRT